METTIERIPKNKKPQHGNMKYPFSSMKKGESFAIDNAVEKNTVGTAARNFCAKHQPNWKFSVSTIEGVKRCTRIK